MSIRYQNPRTNEIETIRFRWIWLITPLFIIELLRRGFFIAALLSIVPAFAIVFFFLYSGKMERRYQKLGWVKLNELGQPILATQE